MKCLSRGSSLYVFMSAPKSTFINHFDFWFSIINLVSQWRLLVVMIPWDSRIHLQCRILLRLIMLSQIAMLRFPYGQLRRVHSQGCQNQDACQHADRDRASKIVHPNIGVCPTWIHPRLQNVSGSKTDLARSTTTVKLVERALKLRSERWRKMPGCRYQDR